MAVGFSNKSREVRRQEFIDATLRCLSVYGYKDTSVRKIAEEAGVTAGLLKHYFEGKDELVAQAYKYISECVLQKIIVHSNKAGTDPAHRMQAFIEGYFFNEILDPEFMRTWISFWSVIMVDPNIAKIQAINYRLYQHELYTLVDEICKTRKIQMQDAEKNSIAIGINSIVDGLWLECCLNPTRMTPAEALKIALDFTASRIGITF